MAEDRYGNAKWTFTTERSMYINYGNMSVTKQGIIIFQACNSLYAVNPSGTLKWSRSGIIDTQVIQRVEMVLFMRVKLLPGVVLTLEFMAYL